MSLTCWTTLWRLRSAPPIPNLGPQVSAAAASFPRKRGWQRSLSPAQLGGGHGSWKELGGGGELVTWANLPQGNEVSSRLLGGNGGGRIRPRLTQAGRGISPRSLQPSPLPPPPPGPLLGTGAQRRESSSPSWPSPEAGVSFRPRFPAPPSSARPSVQELPALGRDRGRGGCHPMGSGQAARRWGSRGRRRARRAHLTVDRVSCAGPSLSRELSSGAQPAGGPAPDWRAPISSRLSGCLTAPTHPG